MSNPLKNLVRDRIVRACHRLVSQAGLLHLVPDGPQLQEMTVAYQELYRLTDSMLTGEVEEVLAATPMTHLSGVVSNLLHYAVHLSDDEAQLVNDTALLDQLEVCIEDIGIGIDQVGLDEIGISGNQSFRQFVRDILARRQKG